MRHLKNNPLIPKLALLGIGLAIFVAGNVTGYLAKSATAATEPQEFAIFWEAWDLVLEQFVDQEIIDVQTMTYGAIRGMLSTLGDENHTVFFSPEEARQQQSTLEGSFEGIGAYVGTEDGRFTVIAPMHGSPAEAAGLRAGDVVVAVDGTEITGKPQWEVISIIRGPVGSAVTLTVLRPGEEKPQELIITRSRIDIDSVLWEPIPGTDFVYLQITQFAADTSRELDKALLAIQERLEGGTPVRGIVLDLRNNPGGYLQEAIEVNSHFLSAGKIILHERDADGRISTYRARGPGLAREIPMVVLINEGTASAAEISAGALQTNHRAKLVGETTLGTGTVLRPFTLSDESVLRLGVTNWLTPDMQLIKGEGIQPDVVIAQAAAATVVDGFFLADVAPDALHNHDDLQFTSALLLLNIELAQNGQTTN